MVDSTGPGPRFSPFKRFLWVEYTDPSFPDMPFRVKMRSDLTFAEADKLTYDKDTLTTDCWEIFAPHVVDWNLDDEEGNPLPSPAAAGGGQFNYLPNGIFWRMWNDLKFRSSGELQAKRLVPDSSKPSSNTGEAGGPTIMKQSA